VFNLLSEGELIMRLRYHPATRYEKIQTTELSPTSHVTLTVLSLGTELEFEAQTWRGSTSADHRWLTEPAFELAGVTVEEALSRLQNWITQTRRQWA
jgi:hypothetical protein